VSGRQPAAALRWDKIAGPGLQAFVLKRKTAYPGIGRTGFGGAADRSGPRQRGHPSRKRFLNPAPRSGEIKPETRSVESPDVWRMQTIVKSSVDGIRIALAVALLAACTVNLLLLCAWL
jgi:hypothetical protein